MQKSLKDVQENKDSKIRFKYSQEEIIKFLQTNIAASILIVLVLLFIVIGSPFVIGALIGGYLGAKRAESLRIISSFNPIILGASIGAVLGGVVLVFSVSIGKYFHTFGGIVGAVAGVGAIVAFSGDLIKPITTKLMKFSFLKNKSKKSEEKSETKKTKTVKKKSKLTKRKSKTNKKKTVAKKK